MITAKRIQEWLDQGYTVKSVCLGRVGTVVSTHEDIVRVKIKGKNTIGVTRFDIGDSVGTLWNSSERTITLWNTNGVVAYNESSEDI